MKKVNEKVVATTNGENLEQFVSENIQFVPKLRMKYFNTLSIEEKVAKLQNWKQRAAMKEQWIESAKVVNRVKDIFKKRGATVEDAKEVVKFCEQFINEFKQAELDKLDEEIRKLQEKRAALQG